MPIFYAAKVSFRVPRRNLELREEKQKSNFLKIYDKKNYFKIKVFDAYVFMSLKLTACHICVFKRSLLGIKICLSHAQIGLL